MVVTKSRGIRIFEIDEDYVECALSWQVSYEKLSVQNPFIAKEENEASYEKW